MDNTIYKSTLLGSISGGIGYICTLPLDAIKQNIQVGQRFTPSFYKHYFKGGIVGICSIVPQMSIKFTTNAYVEKYYSFHPMINGFIAGLCDGAFLGPVLSAQSVQQMNTSIGYKQSFVMIKQQSLIQLSIPMSLRNALYTSVLLGGYRIIPNKKNTFLNDLYYSTLLNIPGTLLCSPADVIRAKQNEFLLKKQPIHVLHVCNEIYKKDGYKGFFRGYPMLYINFAIRFPFTLAIFNYLMRNYK
jgi:hypothetical protein